MTSPILQTNWQASFTSGDDVVGLNLIHPEVIKLLHVTSKDELSESAHKDRIEKITEVKLNSIMFQNTFDEMIILHHNTKIGGGLLNPTVEHFGLFGGGTTAIPLKYKPMSILTINEVESPAWDTIKAIKTPEDIEAARDANPTIRHYPNAVSLPPFITKALLPLESPTAADMFMATIEAANEFDKNKEDTVPSATESLKEILPYLWAAHHKKIGTVETSPHISKEIARKSTLFHNTEILTIPLPSKPIQVEDLTGPPRVIDQMNTRLGQLVSNSIMAQAASSASNKKKFETRLNSLVHTLVLTGSAADSSSIPTEPCASAREFFEQKNPSEAKTYLHHKLAIMQSLPIYIPAGMATAMHQGVFFWDRVDNPSNFSFFLVPAQSSSMMSDTMDSIALSLKSSDGRGGIDIDDIRRLTKQKIFVPTSINELEHHLNHGIHVLVIVFSADSFLVTQLIDFQKHIQANLSTYCDLLRQDPLFATKVLYIIDVRVQNFFKQAQMGKFSPEPLDFTSMFQDIVQNRSFNANLPTSIATRKRKGDNGNGDGNPHNGRPGREDRGAWVRNPHPDSEWKIKTTEDFHRVFHPHRDQIPKRNNVPLCGKFHIQGWCYQNCKFDHGNVERSTPLHNKMTQFCQRCRRQNF